MCQKSGQVTLLLRAIEQGDIASKHRLWQLVYDTVYQLARSQMVGDGLRRTLQPTVLVHEAFLRLMDSDAPSWANRRHFFAAVAEALRRIRVDYARTRRSLKRGGGVTTSSLEHDPPVDDSDPAELLAVDEALARLAEVDPQRADVVKLRYFAGLGVVETAEALGVSPRTIDNHWRMARTWLHRELSEK